MPEARSLRDLLRIRDFHAADLHRRPGCLGTAVGLKYSETRDRLALDDQGRPVPVVLVFLEQKKTKRAVPAAELIPPTLSAPDGLTCRTDVITGRRGTPLPRPETVLSPEDRRFIRELDEDDVGGITGGLPVRTPFTRGTIACVVRRRLDGALGLLTNWHVAGFPGSDALRPPPRPQWLGRTTFSIRDVPGPSYLRIDAAFIALPSPLPPLRAGVHGLPPLAAPYRLDLDTFGPLGRRVISVGQTMGRRTGHILACAYDWAGGAAGSHREAADYLILGEGRVPFAADGDSGKLVVLADGADAGAPVALLWGGQEQHLTGSPAQETWAYASDIGAVLQHLDIEIWPGAPEQRPAGVPATSL